MIEELTYFMPNEPETDKHKIKAKYQLGDKIIIHRFGCFCLKNRWVSVLNIESTVYDEYNSRIGIFDE